MKISCDVIHDLLPLYMQRQTTDATNALVEEHLAECPECQKKLERLREKSKHSGSSRSRGFRKQLRNLLPKLAVLFALLTLFSGIWAWLFNPVWLTYEEAIVSVEEAAHGGVRFVLQDYVRDHAGTNWGDNYGHVWNTTRMDRILVGFDLMRGEFSLVPLEQKEYVIRGVVINDKGGVESYDPELADRYGISEQMTEKNHWYENVYSGTLEELMWDGGQRAPEEGIIEQDKLLILNFAGTIVLTICSMVGCFVIKKYSLVRKFLSSAAVFAGSIALVEGLLTGCRFVTVCVASEPYPTLKWIYIIGCSLALTILSCAYLIKLKKQEKNS